MKTLALISFLSGVLSVTTACAATPPKSEAPKTAQASSGFVEDTYTLKVKGMTCDNCAHSIESAVKKVPGVAEAKADYKSGDVVVTSSGPSKLDKDAVMKAIEKAGYRVQK